MKTVSLMGIGGEAKIPVVSFRFGVRASIDRAVDGSTQKSQYYY